MEKLTTNTNQLSSCIIARSYEMYYGTILSYIAYKINHRCEAEDLAQDVFLRLLDYKLMLQETTIKYFIFTIARNLVTDYLRRYYKKQEVTSYIYDSMAHSSNDSEDWVIARDLLSLEKNKLETFSPQRKKVYVLNRFEEKTSSEISEELNLSRRTVENHLLLGRKIMRAYMRKCI